jgi:ABC-type nitrate/sulfonate/bicarbonate transport system permease component
MSDEAFAARPPDRFARGIRTFRLNWFSLGAILGFAILWQIVSYFVPPFIIPGWERILKAFFEQRFDYVAVTLTRLLVSLAVSFILGVALAAAMNAHKSVEQMITPFVRMLMSVPAICWVVFSILWFKGVELRIFFVMVVVAMPVFLVDTLDGMKAVPRDLQQMVNSFQPTWLERFTKLTLPSILPVVLTSWKINLSQTIRVILTAELVGATSGIGYGLVLAQETFSIADVFALTLTLVIGLYALQGVVDFFEAKYLAWRDH